MSKQDIDFFFDEYFNWMKTDISREIAWARSQQPAGNLLCALGLVAYTEALGHLRIWNRTGAHGTPGDCFNDFLDSLDSNNYMRWRSAWEHRHQDTTLYESLRCGLVHEYKPKIASAFYFSFGDPLGLDEVSGRLIFKIEPYFRHFVDGGEQLRRELLRLPNPEVPPAKMKVATSVAAITPYVLPSS